MKPKFHHPSRVGRAKNPLWPRGRAGATAWLAAAAAAFLAQPASACSVCFGGPGQEVSRIAGLSILFMLLGVVLPVLSGFGFFIAYLMRRQRRFAVAGAAGRKEVDP